MNMNILPLAGLNVRLECNLFEHNATYLCLGYLRYMTMNLFDNLTHSCDIDFGPIKWFIC